MGAKGQDKKAVRLIGAELTRNCSLCPPDSLTLRW